MDAIAPIVHVPLTFSCCERIVGKGAELKVLGLAPYPASIASTRLRLFPVLDELRSRGHEVTSETFLSETDMGSWFGNPVDRARVLASALINLRLRLDAHESQDLVLIQREAAPVNTLLFERRFPKAKKIWDIDDACWNDARWPKSLVRGSRAKFIRMASMVDETWAGSSSTADSIRNFGCLNTHVVPTCAPDQGSVCFARSEKLALWVGTPSTSPYIHTIVEELAVRNPQWHFVVLGASPNYVPLPNVEFRAWSLEAETHFLRRARVGLYPLPTGTDSIVGKSGFRANLFRTFGVPVIATPEPSIAEVMGYPWIGGVPAESLEDWVRAFTPFQDETYASRLGEAGHQFVSANFSLSRWSRRLANRCERLVHNQFD